MKTFLAFMAALMVAGLASAAEPDAQTGTDLSANAQPVTSIPGIQPAAAKLERTFAGRLGAHEPIYFIFGAKAPAAKFQFSFKYKILRFGEPTAQLLPSTLQFAFTQRSLWDITGNSSPFYDTSYMPELFYESLAPVPGPGSGGFTWLGYQAGYKHESNGRSGLDSRSMNALFVRPAFAFGDLAGWHLIVVPEIYAYVGGLTDNDDLTDYRGYGKLRAVVGKGNGPSLMYTGTAGRRANHFTTQLDFTMPIRTHLLDFETYLLVQYFNGYGESLLLYREKTETVRAGFSLVR
jgi:outer membrane phospholipase A